MANDVRRKGTNGISKNDDLEVLLALKRNIFKDLKVASLGKVKEVNTEIAKVSLFPIYQKELEITLDCYFLKNLNIQKNDIVLILFLDRKFNQNLKQIKNNQQLTNLDSNNLDLHSYKNAIIVGII